MDVTQTTLAAEYVITAKRNCSLSSTGRLLFLLLMGVVSFGIASGFAMLGAWLVLPFAGLEMLLLSWAFYHIGCHAGDYERIRIQGDKLMVEWLDYKRENRAEFNRYWAQVKLHCNPAGEQCRVMLRSHGRELEIGRHMNDAQRIQLAHQLQSFRNSVNY